MKQTITNSTYGNCLQTCVAKYMGKPLDYVPNFMLYEDHWWSAFVMYLGIHNYIPEFIPNEAPPEDGREYITSLKFKIHSEGLAHAVIVKDGVVIYDPWPNVDYRYEDSRISGFYKLIRVK